jgi:hypothetical protein
MKIDFLRIAYCKPSMTPTGRLAICSGVERAAEARRRIRLS